MEFAELLQIWFAALFTVWIYSIAFRDNLFFKFAEHTFVGAAAGHSIVYGVDNVRRLGWTPLVQGQLIYLVAFILGIMLYTRYHSQHFWISRFPVSVMAGVGLGLSLRATVTSEFIAQILSTAQMKVLGVSPWWAGLYNLLFIVITVTVVYYFVFTFPRIHAGGLNWISRIARYGMMAAFGYSFANTILSRFQMIFGRLDFLMNSWLPLSGAVIALPIVLVLLAYAMIPASRRPWPKQLAATPSDD